MMDGSYLQQKLCTLLKICPIFVSSNIFECFDLTSFSFCPIFVSSNIFECDLTSFFFFKKVLKCYRSKMMDRYQLEQKSSRDKWQLWLDILENGPNICRLEYFWMLWFDEFFLYQKSVDILSFKDDGSISIRAEIMQFVENMPNFCRLKYFWMLWFDEFFFIKKALKYRFLRWWIDIN